MDYQMLNASAQTSALYAKLTPMIETAGYERRKAVNTGGAQICEIVGPSGDARRVVYKTSRNRWFGFALLGSADWKTLGEDIDAVLVLTVDNPLRPTALQLYEFPANEVRHRLGLAHSALTEAGHIINSSFGVWLNMDPFDKKPYDAGSGLTSKFEPIAVLPFSNIAEFGREDRPASAAPGIPTEVTNTDAIEPATIGGVLDQARQRIAAIAGVAPEAVKLDLNIGV